MNIYHGVQSAHNYINAQVAAEARNLLAEAKDAERGAFAEMALAYSKFRFTLTSALQNVNCTEDDRYNIEEYLGDDWTKDGYPTPNGMALALLSPAVRALVAADCDALAAARDAYCGAEFGCELSLPRRAVPKLGGHA